MFLENQLEEMYQGKLLKVGGKNGYIHVCLWVCVPVFKYTCFLLK